MGPIPRAAQIHDFLGEGERSALLTWAIEHEAAFKPAKVYVHAGEDGRYVDRAQRTALKLRDFGPLRPMLHRRLFDCLPTIIEAIGFAGPLPQLIELELNAYGDGGHFKPHVDILTDARTVSSRTQSGQSRAISAVYYFHQEPKKFSGGALRLFRFGMADAEVSDSDVLSFEPVQNSLVAFPSWTRHEVQPVSCPGNDFRDFRFALNCWFCVDV